MKLSLALTLALLAAIAVAPASAEHGPGETGNTLLSRCGPSVEIAPTTPSIGYCGGYIIGVYETTLWSTNNEICVGDNVTNGQIIDVVLKYVIVHPEIRDHDASLLTAMALRETFPCTLK